MDSVLNHDQNAGAGSPSNTGKPHLRNRLLKLLPRAAIDALEGDLRPGNLPKGFVCAAAGEVIQDVYFPLGGVIATTLTAPYGPRFAASLIGWEGAFGINGALGMRRALGAAVVLLPGPFICIPVARLKEVADRLAGVREIIIRYIETAWAEAQHLAYCHANHDASRRLCRSLLQCADRTDMREIVLTQDVLAEMIAVRRSTATLFAQELQARGIINYSRGKITVSDRRALEGCSCECYKLMHTTKLEEQTGLTG